MFCSTFQSLFWSTSSKLFVLFRMPVTRNQHIYAYVPVDVMLFESRFRAKYLLRSWSEYSSEEIFPNIGILWYGFYWSFAFSSILVSLTPLGLILYLYNNCTYYPWINLNLILYPVTIQLRKNWTPIRIPMTSPIPLPNISVVFTLFFF